MKSITRKNIGTPQYVKLNGVIYERHDREDGEIVDFEFDSDVQKNIIELMHREHCMSIGEVVRKVLAEQVKEIEKRDEDV